MTKNQLLAAKKLYKFLKKECALKAYIDNVMKQHRYDYYFAKLYEKSDILGIINFCNSSIYSSFDWLDTKEGYDFWFNLHHEFMRFKTQPDIWKKMNF